MLLRTMITEPPFRPLTRGVRPSLRLSPGRPKLFAFPLQKPFGRFKPNSSSFCARCFQGRSLEHFLGAAVISTASETHTHTSQETFHLYHCNTSAAHRNQKTYLLTFTFAQSSMSSTMRIMTSPSFTRSHQLLRIFARETSRHPHATQLKVYTEQTLWSHFAWPQ